MTSGSNILAVAQRLGARLKRVSSIEWAGPCPKCGGRDRFSVNVTKQIWNCRGCDVGGDAIDLVRHVRLCTYQEALAFLGDERSHHSAFTKYSPPLPVDLDVERQRKIAAARDLWAACDHPSNTPVERYLKRRRLDLDDEIADEIVRYSPRHCAMATIWRALKDGSPQAVQLTFLLETGDRVFENGRTKRRFVGPCGGAGCLIDGFELADSLFVGEGFESCLAGRQFGMTPVWALGSANGIAAFPVRDGVQRLNILAENDPANAKAIEACGNRWCASNRHVYITRPKLGNDWADTLMMRAAQ